MTAPAPSSLPPEPIPVSEGLFHALALDGKGGAQPLRWKELKPAVSPSATQWLHLDRKSPAAQRWLREKSGLGTVLCDALLAEETRPRVQLFGDGVLAIFRGVNLNPGAAPDDMISVRLWVEEGRVISLRSPRLAAVSDVREQLEQGVGPIDAPSLVIAIATRLTERIWPVVANLNEVIDEMEEQVLENPAGELRRGLGQMRRQAITLRRFIGPQRDAISQLQGLHLSWLTETHRAVLREISDRITRIVEDLDAMRERAAVVQEELSGRLAEQMNRTMYVLSVVAGIFLPLGLLTGLLGINVGGMPGTDSAWAFTLVCVLLVALAVLGIWIFRRMKLL